MRKLTRLFLHALFPNLQSRVLQAPAYVGTFNTRYPPTSPNSRSGDHAASDGGSWLKFPIASKRLDTTRYTDAMPTAVAMPASGPRRPAESEKGIASTGIP